MGNVSTRDEVVKIVRAERQEKCYFKRMDYKCLGECHMVGHDLLAGIYFCNFKCILHNESKSNSISLQRNGVEA